MDEKNNENYLAALPKNIQDFIYKGEWKKRILEVAQKYALDQTQTDNLSEIVTMVLVGLEKPENINSLIITDLGISKLLTEQIIEDLNARVFEYAIKQTEVSPVKIKNDQATPSIAKNTNLEVRPETLPSTTLNIPKEMAAKPAFQNPTLDRQKIPLSPDIGVPRYATGDSQPQFQNARPTSPQPNTLGNSIIESKLNNTTGGIPGKYPKDPYREPLN